MLKQLSIYAENRKGILLEITSILKEEQINILGSATNAGAEFGITRMVVSEPEKAREALEKAGYLCRMVDVLGIELEDEVGNLNSLLKAMSDSNINVDYTYLTFNRDTGKPILILNVEDIFEVESCMKSKGFAAV